MPQGAIVGLIGCNGAGKTTLLRCLLGLLKPTGGRCEMFGEPSWNAPPHVRQRIGYVPQKQESFLAMSLNDMADYFGSFYESWDKAFVDHLISRLDVPRFTRMEKMSEGEKQKAAIVMALGHRPELLVLDEPVASLDPVARHHFMDVLFDLFMDEARTVILSSHIMSDIERVVTDVVMMKGGQTTLTCSLDDLKQSVVRLRLSWSDPSVRDVITALPDKLFETFDDNRAVLTLSSLRDDQLHGLKQRCDSVEVESLGLEDIFLELNR
ncbi:MAG: ABC transporter ATP-binding protein [Pseudomonadales bacterium]|nr:ABC transporter ATP-binding protein [Pseudomonadales bacterium]